MVGRGNIAGARALLEAFTLDDNYLTVCDDIVKTYRSQRQHWATVQEMGELATEISKIEMGTGALPKRIEDEIADVLICIITLAMIHDPKEIERCVNRKLNRELQRLVYPRVDTPIGVDEHARKKESSQEAAPGKEGASGTAKEARKASELQDPEADLGV